MAEKEAKKDSQQQGSEECEGVFKVEYGEQKKRIRWKRAMCSDDWSCSVCGWDRMQNSDQSSLLRKSRDRRGSASVEKEKEADPLGQFRFAHLVEQIRTSFGRSLPLAFRILYEDEDGDSITIGSDLDLLEAITFASSSPTEEKSRFLSLSLKTSTSVPYSETLFARPIPPVYRPGSRYESHSSLLNDPSFNYPLALLLGSAPVPTTRFDEELYSLFEGIGLNRTDTPEKQKTKLQEFLSQSESERQDVFPELVKAISSFVQRESTLAKTKEEELQRNAAEEREREREREKKREEEREREKEEKEKEKEKEKEMGEQRQVEPLSSSDFVMVQNEETQDQPENEGNVVEEETEIEKKDSQERSTDDPIIYEAELKEFSIPAGFECEPGTDHYQIWKVLNTGADAWPEGTRLRSSGKDCLRPESASDIIFPKVKSGGKAEIRIHIVAPKQEDRYLSFYELVTPDDRSFGPVFIIDIVSVSPSQKREKGEEKEEDWSKEERAAEKWGDGINNIWNSLQSAKVVTANTLFRAVEEIRAQQKLPEQQKKEQPIPYPTPPSTPSSTPYPTPSSTPYPTPSSTPYPTPSNTQTTNGGTIGCPERNLSWSQQHYPVGYPPPQPQFSSQNPPPIPRSHPPSPLISPSHEPPLAEPQPQSQTPQHRTRSSSSKLTLSVSGESSETLQEVLKEMGFHDREANQRALEATNGNIVLAIQFLIGETA